MALLWKFVGENAQLSARYVRSKQKDTCAWKQSDPVRKNEQTMEVLCEENNSVFVCG